MKVYTAIIHILYSLLFNPLRMFFDSVQRLGGLSSCKSVHTYYATPFVNTF